MLFFLGTEAVGEVIVTAAVFLLSDRCGGVLHYRLPYHLGEDIHLPLAGFNVLVDEIRVRQRFLHISEGVDGCLAVGKVDSEHFKELVLDLLFGEVGGGAFDGVVELIDALPYHRTRDGSRLLKKSQKIRERSRLDLYNSTERLVARLNLKFFSKNSDFFSSLGRFCVSVVKV